MSDRPASEAGFHPRAFEKADSAPDSLFYAEPRFVEHLDPGATAAVTALYRTVLPAGGVVLDLMSSWLSHLPAEMDFERVVGHGLNEDELAANSRLDSYFVQDLNRNPHLALADGSFDAACLCVSIQYLERPVAVLREVARVLRPEAPLIVTFSDRFFPSKAVALWQALDDADRQRLVALLLSRAGFNEITTGQVLPETDDPIWRDPVHAVIGRTRAPP